MVFCTYGEFLPIFCTVGVESRLVDADRLLREEEGIGDFREPLEEGEGFPIGFDGEGGLILLCPKEREVPPNRMFHFLAHRSGVGGFPQVILLRIMHFILINQLTEGLNAKLVHPSVRYISSASFCVSVGSSTSCNPGTNRIVFRGMVS